MESKENNTFKLKYNIQLAQNAQYCYGPAYKTTSEISNEDFLDHKIKAAETNKQYTSHTEKEERHLYDTENDPFYLCH